MSVSLRSPVIAAALIVAVLLFSGLVGHEPWKPDEAYTWGLVSHIVKTGDVVVPTLAGEPFMEKPPLYFATAAVASRLFSPWFAPHDAARLATGFYMVLAFLFLGLAARELWGKGTAWSAVLTLAGCFGLTIVSHQLITDIALFAGNAVALYGLALIARRPRLGGLFLGTGVGVGFLSKGVLMLVFAGGAVVLLPAISPLWRTRDYAIALVVAAVAALPWLLIWPVALYARSPALFAEWLWVNNWGRFADTAHLGPRSPHSYYIRILPWYAWPAWPLALWALWQRRAGWRLDRAVVLLLTVFIVMFAVLSAARQGRELYALPLLLPLSLLAAGGLASLPAVAARYWRGLAIILFGGLVVLLWLAWVALFLGGPPVLVHWLAVRSPAYIPAFSPALFLQAMLVTVLWMLLLFRRHGIPAQRALLAWTGGLAVVWALAMSIWLPWLDKANGYADMIVDLHRALPAHYNCIASRGLGEPQRALLEYYAGIETKRVEVTNGADCELYLSQDEGSRIAEVSETEWRQVWQGGRPGDVRQHEHYRLFERRTPTTTFSGYPNSPRSRRSIRDSN